MCAMTRQPLLRPLLFLAAFGAGVPACGLDRDGTDFVGLGYPSLADGGIATGVQTRPDAASTEAAAQVPSREVDVGPPDATAAATAVPDVGPALAAPVEDPDGGDAALAEALDDALDDGSSPSGDAAPEAAPPAPTSCDQDGDGHMAAGPPCFGDDCCDTDANVHPGQTAYFTSPSLCGSFDYDCDGASTAEYPVANCQWVGLGCTGDGFVDAAGCGVTAPFSVCASSSVLTCTASVGTLTQACR
jgi:hypothetical protein